MVTETFPEITAIGSALPDGTVLDGEVLAWEGEKPQAFAKLQRRLGRKNPGETVRREFPVVFLAYDLLEADGGDWRVRPLAERRLRLEQIVAAAQLEFAPGEPSEKRMITPDLFAAGPQPQKASLPLRLSEVLHPQDWMELESLQRTSRERHVEGIMLKRRNSPYGVGRQRGAWWKWKINPLVMDAVLVGAQRGHGRRASLYTDYTFSVWHAGQLVPIAKAYSGLNDEEISRVDDFVRKNTLEKFGPVRFVKPELVFELAFEAVQQSTRHKAGLAVRFPRINRWRHDKNVADADTLETVRALMKSGAGHE
jgi:DNA ligase-1